MDIRETVCETIAKYQMLPAGTNVVIGLSGGADSVCLLHLLHILSDRLKLGSLSAVHINHGLRGEEALRDQQFCEQLCGDWEIPLQVFSVDVAARAAETGKGIEETGRQLRYQIFSEVASRLPRARIVTAHTADDNAETLLLHLARGCGLHGLTGIAPVRETIARPLLGCTRAEIEAYCTAEKLPYMFDSSNNDVVYARNRIRHEVLPALRTINPAVVQTLNRFMVQMRETEDFLQHEVDSCWSSVCTDRAGIYQKEPLLAMDSVMRRTLLQRMLVEQNLAWSEWHLRSMEDSLFSGRSVSLPGGYCFCVNRRLIYFTGGSDIPISAAEQPVFEGMTVGCGSRTYRIVIVSRQEYEQKLNICNFLFQNACDYDMIKGVPVVRTKRKGDTYHPVGRGCGKTLKKLFNETALTATEREQIPVICDDCGIILVPGLGCDERVRVTEDTKRVFLLVKVEE